MSGRANGVYYTDGNPFGSPAFAEWARGAGLPKQRILEPFAGANALIWTLEGMGLCRSWKSFDLEPAAQGVERQDTLSDFPKGYQVCVTNPPWLARNSATRRGLSFPDTEHDDLYKLALGLCLDNCEWVAALVPESFIRANLFQKRLRHFVSLTRRMFGDTDHPVGLALFQPGTVQDTMIWRNGEKIGLFSALQQKNLPPDVARVAVRFNDSDGNVGLIAIDDTRGPSIRFCPPQELEGYRIRGSCRAITRLAVEGRVAIRRWNAWLDAFRQDTQDVFLTSFKGVRKDGWYRRRLDWKLARRIVNHVH